MSAFIVSTDTMSKVVAAAIYLNRREVAGIALGTPEAATELGRTLFKLNQAAVCARYNEPDPIPEDYAYRGPVSFGNDMPGKVLIEWFKALRCLSYQCAEGSIPTTPAYADLERLSLDISSRIVSDLPEYRQAKWD